MARVNLEVVEGEFSGIRLHGELLLHVYPAGDCDVVTYENARDLLCGALYDAYQCSDELHDGDEFYLRDELVARCEGVHVVPVGSNYKL